MTGMARCSNQLLEEIVGEISSSRTWWIYVLARPSLSCFISAPESVDSWGNGDWRFSGRHQEAHTTLHSEFAPICDHMHLDSYIYQTKSCDFLRCDELAQSFPSGAITVVSYVTSLEIKFVYVKCPVINYSLFVACYCFLGPLKPFLDTCPHLFILFASDWSKWILLCNWSKWICPAASQSPTKGMASGPMHHFMWLMSWSIILFLFMPHGCTIIACTQWKICRITDGAASFQTFPYAVTSSIFRKGIHSPVTVWLDINRPKMSARRSFTPIWDENRYKDLAANWHIYLRIKDKKRHYCIE